METIDEELHFLILRYLEDGPCKDAAKVLKEEVKKFKLLPKKIDWEGRNYPRTYEELVSTHPHVAANHLKRVCSRLPGLLDDKFPPRVLGVQSLLGAGSQSLLRSEKTAGVTLRPSSYLSSQHSGLSPLPNSLTHRPHILRCLQGTEYTGKRRTAETQPVELFGNYRLQRRFLGHLSAVYCVLYDRTGNFIFTGADDKLVKVWSALTGRLLATLRGHDGEIVDIAVNYENTLLASGSCDRMVRIWCLKTTICLAVLHGHAATVTSLQFCPLVRGSRRYLVSTSEDATVCFWHYQKETKEFESQPLKFTEKSRTGAKMLCSSFSPGGLFLATGNSDSVIRIYCLLGANPEKISELEAHMDMVDSIQYSNYSDRFISGSKDGTARIWRLMRNEWLNLILNMKSERRPGADNFDALKVNMVAWTSRDDFVLTAVSDFSVRVWCSTTGSLITSLKGHGDDVFVIECATFNSNLVVTAGHDGHIILWDLLSGRRLMDYYNMIDGQGFGAAYDCKWSPHNHSFSATDSHGHLMRFGVGTNDRLSEDQIPSELYFHTDYRGLIRDGNDHVLDELTQRAVHLQPPPFLVNVDAIPYPPKYQRLVPGREHLPEQYLKALLINLPNGDREVIDQDIPLALRTAGQSDNHASSTHQSAANAASTSQSSHSASSSSAGESAVANAAPPATEGNVANQYLKNVISEMSEHLLRIMELARIEVTEREQRQYIAEARKKPFQDDEQPMSSSSEPVYLRTRRRRPANYRTRTARRQQEQQAGEQAVRNRLTTRALYDTDVESEGDRRDDSVTYQSSGSAVSSSEEEPEVEVTSRERKKRLCDGMQSDGGSYNGSSSCSDSANRSSSDYSDWEVDNQAILHPPTRQSSRRATASQSLSLTASPRSYSPSQGNTSHASNSKNVTKSTPRKSKYSSRASRARRRAKKFAARFNSSIAESSIDQDGAAVAAAVIQPSDWLAADKVQKSPYFPQIGDEVIYFFQGHMSYVQEVVKHKLYEPNNLPWDKVTHLREQELARVKGIKFETKGSHCARVCSLKLGTIYPDTKKFTGTEFTVKYHDMPGVLDFLVLRQFYETSQQRNWQVGDRFRSIIDDKWWTGTVTLHEPYDPLYPDSQFLCLKVKWDDGSDDSVSPWDLEPLADDAAEDEMLRGTEITAADRATLNYMTSDQEWNESDPVQECARLSNCLEQLMGYSVSEQFNTPVDVNAFPEYQFTIAYPMDLSRIRARLDNGFYRRISAVQFDVRHLVSNAEQFNEPGSDVVADARIVTDVSLSLISDRTCVDTHSKYSTMDQTDEYYAKSHSRSKKRSSKSSKTYDWKSVALAMLDEVFATDDSEPFRAPVDVLNLPGYYDIIDTPMDLTTVRENLECEEYDELKDFCKDVRLIFSNSRKYNTQKRSRIYTMTIRLSAKMEDRMRTMENCVKRLSHQSTSKGRSTRNSRYHVADPLTTLDFGARSTRTGRNRDHAASSYQYNGGSGAASSSSGAVGTSRYSTRSTTGRLKPKQFGDDILVDVGSFVQVSRKPRRIVESSDDEITLSEDSAPASTSNRASRGARNRLETVSDYEKDTDAEEEKEKDSGDDNPSEEDTSDVEVEDATAGSTADEISDEDTASVRQNVRASVKHTSKRPIRSCASQKAKKAKVNSQPLPGRTRKAPHKTAGAISNGRSSRLRHHAPAGIYKETDSEESSCGFDEEAVFSSRRRKRARR